MKTQPFSNSSDFQHGSTSAWGHSGLRSNRAGDRLTTGHYSRNTRYYKQQKHHHHSSGRFDTQPGRSGRSQGSNRHFASVGAPSVDDTPPTGPFGRVPLRLPPPPYLRGLDLDLEQQLHQGTVCYVEESEDVIDDSTSDSSNSNKDDEAEESEDPLPWKPRSVPLVEKRGKTEIEVIKEWFVNIFQPVEKTADLEVVHFKFQVLERNQQQRRKQHRKEPTRGPLLRPSSFSNHHSLISSVNSSIKNGLNNDVDNNASEPSLPFGILKKADVDLLVGGKPKHYSVIIKVLPTDDPDRHTDRAKFDELLQFSKEVQVYQHVIHSMNIFDEKRYPSACVEPPVPRCFLSQLDAQNDVIVLENLSVSGYRHFSSKNLLTGLPSGIPGGAIGDLDHCKVVLRRLAHFHAISTLIQRDAEMSLYDLYPFVTDATAFQKRFWKHVEKVRKELVQYLKNEKVVEEHLTDLFWKLVELRGKLSDDRRLSVLIHGNLEPRNILFQYEEEDPNGRPVCARFIDYAALTVSSPVIDVAYFLHRSVQPEISTTHHSTLLHHYFRSHLEAVTSFGMHGFELDMDTLLQEYKSKQDYGAMMACFLKPALYVLQAVNAAKNERKERRSNGSERNGENNGEKGTSTGSRSSTGSSDSLGGCETSQSSTMKFPPTVPTEKLKIERDLVPIDIRLHGHLANLAKSCPCPCSIGGSRELRISEFTNDPLEDLKGPGSDGDSHSRSSQLGLLDCGEGGVKKLLLGLISSPTASKDEEMSIGGAKKTGRTHHTNKKI